MTGSQEAVLRDREEETSSGATGKERGQGRPSGNLRRSRRESQEKDQEVWEANTWHSGGPAGLARSCRAPRR